MKETKDICVSELEKSIQNEKISQICEVSHDIDNRINEVLLNSGHGYIKLVDISGSEEKISMYAGISYQSKKGPSVSKLMKMGHMSPLEFASVTFEVKAPIFVARQWFRHRTGHYMEMSLRYCEPNFEFYIPEDIDEEKRDLIRANNTDAMMTYNFLLSKGVIKEQARSVLPVSIYTTFYFNIDMRNYVNFLRLRMDKHAQKEIREYARNSADIVEQYFPSIIEFVKEELK